MSTFAGNPSRLLIPEIVLMTACDSRCLSSSISCPFLLPPQSRGRFGYDTMQLACLSRNTSRMCVRKKVKLRRWTRLKYHPGETLHYFRTWLRTTRPIKRTRITRRNSKNAVENSTALEPSGLSGRGGLCCRGGGGAGLRLGRRRGVRALLQSPLLVICGHWKRGKEYLTLLFEFEELLVSFEADADEVEDSYIGEPNQIRVRID